MKLNNWRCEDCGHDHEELVCGEPEQHIPCPKCGGKAVLFNFKQSQQRAFVNDARTII